MPYKHIEDKRAHAKNYYKKHGEKIRKQAHDWYIANKDDPDKMARHRESAKRWQQVNRGRYLHHKREHTIRNPLVRMVQEAKRSGCALCPETHPSCLQFHHTDPSTKSFNISSFISDASQKAAYLEETQRMVQEEMSKCVVICSNCRWKVHAKVIALGA